MSSKTLNTTDFSKFVDKTDFRFSLDIFNNDELLN